MIYPSACESWGILMIENMSNHKLYLGLYSFQIRKKTNKIRERNILDIDNFLDSIKDTQNNTSGFTVFFKEVVKFFNHRAIKTKDNTQGGALVESVCSSDKRTIDLLVNGGNTGILQYIIDEEGNTETIEPEKIVGLKFYFRIWLPAGGKTGYVFIQHYNTLRITKLAEHLITSTLKSYNLRIDSNSLKSTTTEARRKLFMESSSLKHITVISKKSIHEVSSGNAKDVSIKLTGIKNIISDIFKLDKAAIRKALKKTWDYAQ